MKGVKHTFFYHILPEGWLVKTVDEIKAAERYACVAGPFGSSISAKYFTDDGVPVIRGCNLSDNSQRFVATDFVFISKDKARSFPGQHVKPGDLVFTCWGTLGQVGLIPKDGPFAEYVISNKQLKLRPNAGLCDKNYLFYYFSLPQMVQHINDISIGAAVPGINLGLLKKIKVVVPPLATQRKIAAILTAYDDLIETNKRRIALLEKHAEEIYREWFVRMRFPGHKDRNFIKGLPVGWEIKRLGDILQLAYGKALTESDREPGEFHVYGSGGIVGSHSRALVKGKGIVVGRKGNVGAVYFSDRGFFPIDTVFYVISALPLSFLFFLLRTMNFINNDAAVPGLNRNQVYANQLYFPGDSLIENFAYIVDPIFQMTHQLAKQNNTLTKTRDLLLPRLISGKLSVADLDIQFPPSMRDERENADRNERGSPEEAPPPAIPQEGSRP